MVGRHEVTEGRTVYTCNCGWIDSAHADSTSPRQFVGATSLWQQIKGEKGESIEVHTEPFSLRRIEKEVEEKIRRLVPPPYRWPPQSGQLKTWQGHVVRYRQDGAIPGLGPIVTVGRERSYVVRYGLSDEEKKSVALAIFQEVTALFEGFQGWAAPSSSFSVEELVSNLIGFYVAIGELNWTQVWQKCSPISHPKFAAPPKPNYGKSEESLPVWDARYYNKPWEQVKNRQWKPLLAPSPGKRCQGKACTFPSDFTRIRPARKGTLFVDYDGGIAEDIQRASDPVLQRVRRWIDG